MEVLLAKPLGKAVCNLLHSINCSPKSIKLNPTKTFQKGRKILVKTCERERERRTKVLKATVLTSASSIICIYEKCTRASFNFTTFLFHTSIPKETLSAKLHLQGGRRHGTLKGTLHKLLANISLLKSLPCLNWKRNISLRKYRFPWSPKIMWLFFCTEN